MAVQKQTMSGTHMPFIKNAKHDNTMKSNNLKIYNSSHFSKSEENVSSLVCPPLVCCGPVCHVCFIVFCTLVEVGLLFIAICPMILQSFSLILFTRRPAHLSLEIFAEIYLQTLLIRTSHRLLLSYLLQLSASW